MMFKDIKKKIARAMTRWVYRFFSWVFRVLPYGIVKVMAGALLAIGYTALWWMRRIAMQTLSMAFGKEKSKAELQNICKECFYNFGRGAIELGVFTQRPYLIKQTFSFDKGSRENLEAALAQGRGVIAISAHFGNFPLMLLYLSQMGYPTNAIIRPARDPVIEQDFQAARSRLGLKTIHSYPRESCVSQSLKALRDKELLVVLLDQNTGSKSGVYVDFFGQKAGTATGPVIFAMRTGAALLPIFTLRKGHSDCHIVVVEPHFYLEKRATDEETIQYNVQNLTHIIEGYIRRYPKEWSWMHRRWKSRPPSVNAPSSTGEERGG